MTFIEILLFNDYPFYMAYVQNFGMVKAIGILNPIHQFWDLEKPGLNPRKIPKPTKPKSI